MLEIKEECEIVHTRESFPTKRFEVEDTDTPLKKPIKQIVIEEFDVNNMPKVEEVKTELAKRVEADKLTTYSGLKSGTCTEMDDTSSYMCSQAGSPFKKARRTRDERRKGSGAARKEN